MQYGDLILHGEVRQLYRGQVLRRFGVLNNIVQEFLEEKDELHEEKLFCVIKMDFFDLAFTVDVISHLNDLNLELRKRKNHRLVI